MSAMGWMWLRRLVRSALTRESRPRTHSQRRAKTIPGLERLEAMSLLSTGMHLMSAATAHVDRSSNLAFVSHINDPQVVSTDNMSSAAAAVSSVQTPVTLPAQTVSLGATPTNFTNQPLSPDVNLFDPSLGTLLSVTVSHTATIVSNITSQNLSASSPTVITASLAASSQIDGLNQTISQPTQTISSQPMAAGVFGSGTDTVTFPPTVLTDSATTTFTDAASLAFFTSSSGRSAIGLTMTATGEATASAPDGNLLTTTQTLASSSVTVTYTYLPPTPPPTPCPTVASVGRIGVHHQRTELVVTFNGTVDPAKADNPANYSVITQSGKTIPIVSASFNPATNAVTLIPAHRLNVHYHYKLSLVLPCANDQTPETVVVPFGTKFDLIGFHNKRGEFVSVQNGRISGFTNNRDEIVPVQERGGFVSVPKGRISGLTNHRDRVVPVHYDPIVKVKH
jgi:hypothetical protein